MSILTKPFSTKHLTAPFSKISNKDFYSAFKSNIDHAKTEIDTIINNSDAPTFENTIAALDYSGEQLNRLISLFYNLNAAETNDEIQKIAQKVSPLLSEFNNDITLNEALFKRVQSVYEHKDSYDLTPEQQTLLYKKYQSFTRNGALLSQEKKELLREIDVKLSKLQLTFGENVLAETHKYSLHLKDEKDLKGLPDSVVEAAKGLAQSKQKKGWMFTLDYPSYIPFVTYAENRKLRKEITIAAGKKGFQNNKHNNQDNVLSIAKLRYERAQLLGYNSHAHFILEERMAETPEKVIAFLNDFLQKAKPAAEKEFSELTASAKQLDGIEQLEKWDGAYYSEKLKQERYKLDDEVLKPYFKLENVLKGVMTIANKLYNLTFKEVFDIDTYHEDVSTYEVIDSANNLIAVFYTDFFPRKGKRNGAWMTSYKPQYIKNNFNSRPHISIVCNFTPPTATKPSLLTFREVTTLFHEFGHALHGILANTTYPSLSGTSVYWDFVELPSQIMENWCYEPKALTLFAEHYQSGEIIPQSYIEKIRASSQFLEGMATLRQISLGLLDMAYHNGNPNAITNLKVFERNVFKDTQLYPDIVENCMSTSFSHIFQGGYSSGYYSYKWAEVLDADAFDFFKSHDIFDPAIASLFKEHILSKGGTEHPMLLYKRFRGKEPNPEALLKRAGLSQLEKVNKS